MSFMAVNNLPDFTVLARVRAAQLIGEADGILGRSDRGAAFHQAAQQKAVEISDFLQERGQTLDAGGFSGDMNLVTVLGGKVDQLAAAVRETQGSVMQSPTAAFFASLGKSAEDASKDGPDKIVLLLVLGIGLAIALR